MSNRRRHYPTAQYQLNQQVPPQGQNLGYTGTPGAQPDPNAQAYGAVPNNGYPQPGAAQVDAATQSFSNLNIGANPVNGYQQPAQQYPGQPYQQPQAAAYGQPQTYGQPQAFGQSQAPAYGQAPAAYGATSPYDASKQQQSALPLNQLYQSDLLSSLPPPIADLSLPPPPLIIAPNSTVIPNNTAANNNTEFIRSTLNAAPNSSSLLKKSKLPFALVIRPYISLNDETKPVPVSEDSVISRCRRCRTYINPFVEFSEQGKRWRCNMCHLNNDVPAAFDVDVNTQVVVDRYSRKELNYGVVEFIAPKEYMARVPQPLVYIFVLDVSFNSIKSGLLATVATTILESLDRIPNKDERTKVAFLAVDSSLHFFSIPEDSEEKENSLITVPDLDEPFIPSPEGLLVNLKESRKSIENLLENIGSYFANNNQPKFALGPALKSAHKLIESIGGKIIAFGSTLPDIGVGKLVIRDEASVSDKPKEASALLSANDSFYKSFAIDCNKSQVTIEFFLTGAAYQDVASLSYLPKFTAGQTHYYPSWSAGNFEDVTKLTKELTNTITSDLSLEAVVRTRGSNGLRLNNYYGNFFNRASDLCSFPTFPRDQSYVFEVQIEENINKPFAYFQSAVLHSTSSGERRIRVITIAIPTTGSISDVFASADQLAITNYFTHKAIEKVYSSSFNDAREYLNKSLIDIFNVFKKDVVSGNISGSSPLLLSSNLRMLPLLLHSLTKHLGLRPGKVPADHRANALNLLGSLPLPQLIKYIYPSVFSLHDIPDDVGLPDEETGEIKLPSAINASIASFEKYGLYLIDNTTELFLWIGGESVSELVNDVFGIPDIFQVPVGKVELPVLENDFNVRVRNIVNKVRESHDTVIYKNLYIIRGGSANEPLNAVNAAELASLRLWASSNLIEDRLGKQPSYREFLTSTKDKLAA